MTDIDQISALAARMRDEADKYPYGEVGFLSEEILAILDDRDALTARLAEAEASLGAYRRSYGCLACGEDHEANVMCPPHEMRTTGLAWYDEKMRKAVSRLAEAEAHRDKMQAYLDNRTCERDEARADRDAITELMKEMEGRFKAIIEILSQPCAFGGFSSNDGWIADEARKGIAAIRAALGGEGK